MLTLLAASAHAETPSFSGGPGTGAPPAKLGPYFMERFGPDPQALGATVSTVASPIGPLGFEPSLQHLRINEGWGTWSNGYGGDVYYAAAQVVTLTLPAQTKAIYFYGEPQGLGTYSITAETSGGTTSGPVAVQGFGGARYYGFYDAGESSLSSITVTSTDPTGFALGEFGISAGAPTVRCEKPDGSWHASNVSVECTASEAGGSGLAHPAEEASFTLTTSVGSGSEQANAVTGTREICDAIGNCTVAGPIGPFKVDRKPPAITVSSPLDGAQLAHGAEVQAEFACSDGGSGVAACEGSTPNGELLPTDSPGVHSFNVSARDDVGNASAVHLEYTVLPAPPTLGSVSVSELTKASVTLHGSVNPNGGTLSSCRFEYGTSSGYGNSAPCTPMPGAQTSSVIVSAEIGGLSPNTLYHFRLGATNAGGTTEGADQTFTTLPPAPTILVASPTQVAQTSATLNATVNPNGGQVSSCRFEYGSTASYGHTAACAPSPGSGSSPVAVSGALESLTRGATYHYRIAAANAGGESASDDHTITTLPNRPKVVTGEAAPVTQTTATLHATVNPEASEVTECFLEYGVTTGYGHTASCSPPPGAGSNVVSTSASLSGLAPNTTYHYRIVAVNAGGLSSGVDRTFVTLPNAPTVETDPASSVTAVSATLHASVDPHGGLVTDCRLEYGTTASYGKQAPCSPSPGSATGPVAVSAEIAGLSPNTTYHYRVLATNAGGTSQGADETLTTLPPGPPSVETQPAAPIGRATATANATVNPEGALVTDCHFDYGTTATYGHSVPCSPAPGSGASTVAVTGALSGLSPSTQYHFRIVATNGGGTRAGADETFTTEAAVAPSVSTGNAASVTASSANLGGTVNPNELAVSECRFEYGTTNAYGSTAGCTPTPGAGGAPVAVAATVSGLSGDTTYHFRLAATNAVGTSYGADETFTTVRVPQLEVGLCTAVGHSVGSYRDAGCTESAGGEHAGAYEWQPWPLPSDRSEFKGGAVKLESAGRTTITCRNNTLETEFTGADTAGETLILTGCEATRNVSGACSSEGAAAGEVRLNAIEAQLGVIVASASSTPGWSFSPVGGADLADFKCGATPLSIRGAVAGQISVGGGSGAIGKMFTKFTVKFTSTKGRQKVTGFEGHPPESLELVSGSHAEQLGLKMKSVVAVGERFEIRVAPG